MSTSTLHLKHQSKLTIPFGKLQSVLDWCNHNCEKDWAWSQSGSDSPFFYSDIHRPVLYVDYTFSFESDKDYLAFILVHE
jgi:hypothetical protein